MTLVGYLLSRGYGRQTRALLQTQSSRAKIRTVGIVEPRKDLEDAQVSGEGFIIFDSYYPRLLKQCLCEHQSRDAEGYPASIILVTLVTLMGSLLERKRKFARH